MQHMNNLKRRVLMCNNPIVYQKVSRVHELYISAVNKCQLYLYIYFYLQYAFKIKNISCELFDFIK